MSATLSGQLKGRVAGDLVADIVWAVPDQRGQSNGNWEVEPMLIEARQRLERFAGAGAVPGNGKQWARGKVRPGK